MRCDWDERARRNAFLYIASWRDDWDEGSFFESGEQDYLRLVEPILKKLHLDPADRSMAELGCGAGRMTHSFAKRFRCIAAVDISPEMQRRAQNYLQSVSNIRWVLTDGTSLGSIESSSVDFVFSYLVLQHMPNKEVVFGAVREMMRILSPSGGFLFQFNGSDSPSMNWKGRFICGVLDRMSSLGLKRTTQNIARLAGIDPGMVGTTWRGASLSSLEIREAVLKGGASSAEFLDPETPMAWCYGRKQS
jgi:ubiquinone/menaquinone biosynthesis C-methylase UbiE